MNTRVLWIALLLTMFSTDCFTQFVYKNVGVSGLGAVSAVSFLSPDSGYVASFEGKIHKTTNGGATWERVYQEGKMKYVSMKFFDMNTGWAVGAASSVHFTTNGGSTWQRRYLNNPGEPAGELLDVSFLNRDNGVISTGQGMVYLTNNGGGTWRKTQTGVWHDLTGIRWIDSTTIVAVGYATIIVSRDGGVTWQIRGGSPATRYNGLDFADNNTGFAVSEQGEVTVTNDGGFTWRKYTSANNTAKNQKRGAAGDANNFLIAVGGFNGTAGTSKDGGQNWQNDILSRCELRNATFVNPNFGLLTGDCDQVWTYRRTPPATPQLSFSSNAVGHGTVFIAKRSRRTIKAWNNGSEDLVITDVQLEGTHKSLWSVRFSHNVIPPASFASLHFDFVPDSVGEKSASIRIGSNDTGNPIRVIDLTGTGVQPVIEVEPKVVDFGSVPVFTTVHQVLRVQNVSNTKQEIQVRIEPANTIFTCPLTSFSLEAGKSKEVSISFTPNIDGSLEGGIWFDHGDHSLPTTTSRLIGFGLRPIFFLSKTTVDFGEVNTQTAKYDTVLLKNIGAIPVIITSITTSASGSDGDMFHIMGMPPQTLQPGSEQPMILRFLPLSSGRKDMIIQIRTNDPIAPQSTLALKGLGIDPVLTLNRTSIDFGVKYTIESIEQTVRLQNTGTTPLRILRTTIDGISGTDFSIAKSPATTLNPNQQTDMILRFRPSSEGLIDANLRIESTDRNSPAVVELTGVGIKTRLMLPNQSHAFGNVRIHSVAEARLNLENIDDIPHPFPKIELEGNDRDMFEFIPPKIDTIDTGMKVEIIIRFQPSKTGSRVVTMRFTTDAPLYPSNTYVLTGTGATGILMPLPRSVQFGNVIIDRFHKKTLQVVNSGALPLTITSCRIEGPDKDLFSVLTRCDTIIPGGFAKKDFVIQFIPVRLGVHEATLHLHSDDPFTPETIVPLSGNALLTSVSSPMHVSEISLEQNSPNPFRTETEIAFSLPHVMHARLTLHDLYGRRIGTLVDRALEAGRHVHRYRLDELPVGIYIYRLEVEGTSITKRLIVFR